MVCAASDGFALLLFIIAGFSVAPFSFGSGPIMHGTLEERMQDLYTMFGGASIGLAIGVAVDLRFDLRNRLR